MVIIDKSGRIFGKINILDFFALLFLAGLIPAAGFVIKVVNLKPPLPDAQIFPQNPEPDENKITEETIEIMADCLFEESSSVSINALAVGDKEINAKGETVAEIISLGKARSNLFRYNVNSDGRLLKDTAPQNQMFVLLKLKTTAKVDFLYFKGQPLFHGSLIVFETKKYTVPLVLMAKNADLRERIEALEHYKVELPQAKETHVENTDVDKKASQVEPKKKNRK